MLIVWLLLLLCALRCNGQTELTNLGCWRDAGSRAISTAEGTSSLLDGDYWTRINARNKCASVAKLRGYNVFAIQNGGWCATSPIAEQTYAKYGKSTACASDGDGGPWANEVYKINTVNPKFINLGCWVDTADRAIPTAEGTSDILQGTYQAREDAVNKCATVAKERGYNVFALQHGGWCATSSIAKQTYRKYGKSTACATNGKGGPWANQVYEFVQAELTNLGCWRDAGSRAISTVEGSSSLLDGDYWTRINARNKCASVAKLRGYNVFAIQHGGWCATSPIAEQTYAKYGKSTACASDGDGGPWANEVYKINSVNPKYISLGCWADTADRAIPTAEGTSNILQGTYQAREDAVNKCATVAKERGHNVFALQNGGWCATSSIAKQTYRKYGKSTGCSTNGKGGPWANQVYEFV